MDDSEIQRALGRIEGKLQSIESHFSAFESRQQNIFDDFKSAFDARFTRSEDRRREDMQRVYDRFSELAADMNKAKGVASAARFLGVSGVLAALAAVGTAVGSNVKTFFEK